MIRKSSRGVGEDKRQTGDHQAPDEQAAKETAQYVLMPPCLSARPFAMHRPCVEVYDLKLVITHLEIHLLCLRVPGNPPRSPRLSGGRLIEQISHA
jgi:hypothetical protein